MPNVTGPTLQPYFEETIIYFKYNGNAKTSNQTATQLTLVVWCSYTVNNALSATESGGAVGRAKNYRLCPVSIQVILIHKNSRMRNEHLTSDRMFVLEFRNYKGSETISNTVEFVSTCRTRLLFATTRLWRCLRAGFPVRQFPLHKSAWPSRICGLCFQAAIAFRGREHHPTETL